METRYELTQGMLEGALELPKLLQLTNTTEEAPLEGVILNEAVRRAEDEFESYAGAYYALPVRLADGAPPPFVQTQLSMLVVYHLLARKPAWLAEGGEMSHFQTFRKELLSWMKGLANPDGDRRVRITGAVELAAPEIVSGDEIVFDSPEPLRMTRNALRGVL